MPTTEHKFAAGQEVWPVYMMPIKVRESLCYICQGTGNGDICSFCGHTEKCPHCQGDPITRYFKDIWAVKGPFVIHSIEMVVFADSNDNEIIYCDKVCSRTPEDMVFASQREAQEFCQTQNAKEIEYK